MGNHYQIVNTNNCCTPNSQWEYTIRVQKMIIHINKIYYNFLESNRVFLLAVGYTLNVGILYRLMIPHWIYMGISALKNGAS